MDHYPLEGSNIRVHSRNMSRGCARIIKPPYTPPRGTCLFVNLLIRWRVTDNRALPSSHSESWRPPSPVHPNPWHDTLCHHKPLYIFPQNSHHTYLQGISIAFPRDIAMQHPPSHDLIFISYMLLA